MVCGMAPCLELVCSEQIQLLIVYNPDRLEKPVPQLMCLMIDETYDNYGQIIAVTFTISQLWNLL